MVRMVRMVRIITTYGEKGENVKTGEKGMMGATVLNCTLVDVLAFKCVAVQSGEGKFFLSRSKIDIFQPPSLLAGTFKRARQICAGT